MYRVEDAGFMPGVHRFIVASLAVAIVAVAGLLTMSVFAA
jgi:hypothetical protein